MGPLYWPTKRGGEHFDLVSPFLLGLGFYLALAIKEQAIGVGVAYLPPHACLSFFLSSLANLGNLYHCFVYVKLLLEPASNLIVLCTWIFKYVKVLLLLYYSVALC